MKVMKRRYGVILAIVLTLFLVLGGFTVVMAEEDKKVDLNKATVQELEVVPELSAELAEKIVQHREDNGDFVDFDELLDIDGFDSEKLRKIKKYLKIESGEGCNC